MSDTNLIEYLKAEWPNIYDSVAAMIRQANIPPDTSRLRELALHAALTMKPVDDDAAIKAANIFFQWLDGSLPEASEDMDVKILKSP